MDHVQSNANYPELPRQIRANEVDRSKRAVAAFEEIRKGVMEAAKSQPNRPAARPAAAFAGAGAQGSGSGGEAMSRQADAPGAAFFGPTLPPAVLLGPATPAPMTRAESPEDKKHRETWARATEHREHLDSKSISSMEEAFVEARRRHWIHDGAFAMKAPRQELGFSNLFGSGKHASDYRNAEALIGLGKFQLQMATVRKATVLAEFARLERESVSGKKVSVEAMKSWMQGCQELMKRYSDARDFFKRATATYRVIEKANPNLRRWEIPERMPDGHMR